MAITKVKYPIWFDKSYFIPESPYTLRKTDGTIIYSGYAKSSEENSEGVNIYLKSIFMNYLTTQLTVGGNGEYNHNTTQTQVFQLWVGEETEPRFEMTIWYDWSYSYDAMNTLLNTGGIISQPINFHWNSKQIIPVSFFESTNLNVWTYHYQDKDGEHTVALDVFKENDFTTTMTIRPESNNVSTFRIENDTQTVMEWKKSDETCAYGALYYINSLGGWDSYLLEYNIIEKQDIDRQNYSTGSDYFSNTFDETYITKSIRTTYSTNTGWLTDTQSKLLYDHLFASPVIYFQNFNAESEQSFVPVNLTKTNWTKKEFKNGKHLISYDIEFKTSHIKQRQ